jgi:hypothetical protein
MNFLFGHDIIKNLNFVEIIFKINRLYYYYLLNCITSILFHKSNTYSEHIKKIFDLYPTYLPLLTKFLFTF